MDEAARAALWAKFATAAITTYEEPDGIKDDELVDDVVDFSSAVADEMVSEYSSRFASAPRRESRAKRRRER